MGDEVVVVLPFMAAAFDRCSIMHVALGSRAKKGFCFVGQIISPPPTHLFPSTREGEPAGLG